MPTGAVPSTRCRHFCILPTGTCPCFRVFVAHRVQHSQRSLIIVDFSNSRSRTLSDAPWGNKTPEKIDLKSNATEDGLTAVHRVTLTRHEQLGDVPAKCRLKPGTQRTIPGFTNAFHIPGICSMQTLKLLKKSVPQ